MHKQVVLRPVKLPLVLRLLLSLDGLDPLARVFGHGPIPCWVELRGGDGAGLFGRHAFTSHENPPRPHGQSAREQQYDITGESVIPHLPHFAVVSVKGVGGRIGRLGVTLSAICP
jgi:hypothetical protein